MKGRKFRAPKQIPARPTTDFAKEALFNILDSQIEWPRTDMVDLFAGIGGISLEALSRGARTVTSVDRDYHAVKWLTQVKKELLLSNWNIVRADAIKHLSSIPVSTDLIFADPPYEFTNYDLLIDKIAPAHLINAGLFILEHRRSFSFKEHANFADERTYGEVGFTFFRN